MAAKFENVLISPDFSINFRKSHQISKHWKKLTCSTMCLKCGLSVVIPWKSSSTIFFPFPRCGTETECRISVVIVWNQNVELVWKLCGISVIKHIERILCGTSVEFFTFHIVEHQIHSMEYGVPQCRISVEL